MTTEASKQLIGVAGLNKSEAADRSRLKVETGTELGQVFRTINLTEPQG